MSYIRLWSERKNLIIRRRNKNATALQNTVRVFLSDLLLQLLYFFETFLKWNVHFNVITIF